MDHRADITDLIARYSRAVDTRRWDDLDRIFVPEALIDYGAMGGISGDLATVKGWLADTLAVFATTQHMMGLPVIDVDGDRATAVAPCHNPMVVDGRVLVCSLWYHLDLLLTPDGWRIAGLREEKCHMSFLTDLTERAQP